MSTMEHVALPSLVERQVSLALDQARQSGQPALVSTKMPAPPVSGPLCFFAAASAALGDGVYWSQTASGTTFAGAGVALEITADSRDRFQHVSHVLGQLRRQRAVADLDLPLIGGFAFDQERAPAGIWADFPSARFVVPTVLLQIRGSESLIRISLTVHPHDTFSTVAGRIDDLRTSAATWIIAPLVDHVPARGVTRRSVPDRDTWQASVTSAVSAIRMGEFDKIVLAREERLTADREISPIGTLANLQSSDPNASVFAMQSGRSWFLGATPERLVRLEGRRVDVSCLAGSIASATNPVEREALAQKLLASAKDREEHEIVVRSTMAALGAVCDDVSRLGGTPRVVTARSVQHLESPLSARASADSTVIDLAARLHPTPAVGGFPAAQALSALRDFESIDRGWYAGPFGWVDLNGSGEFVVAIRSALVSGNSASLFAGGGIVAGSDPVAEFAETELKLRPLKSALSVL